MKFYPSMTRKEVENENPGAAKIVKVDGGYMAFDTLDEYDTWINQN